MPHRKEGAIAYIKGVSHNVGKDNPQWKDNPGRTALHEWVRTKLPKPDVCPDCKVSPPLDLANISQDYKRELSDWEWLCRKCHMTKDGRLAKFIERNKTRKEVQNAE